MVFEYADYNLYDYFCLYSDLFQDDVVVFMFFWKILSAVNHLHQSNIVHRDLKLENIFIFLKNGKEKDRSGKKLNVCVKIGDLGLSTICEKDEKLTQYCGSPLYSAPEVNLGIPYNGFKYDIWSLGIILYYLFCGSFPFNAFKHEISDESNDDEELRRNLIILLFRKIQNDSVSFKNEKIISEEAKSLIQILLNKNPDERPYIQEVINHTWIQKKREAIKNKKSETITTTPHNHNNCKYTKQTI